MNFRLRTIFIYLGLFHTLNLKYAQLDQACNKNSYGLPETEFRPFTGGKQRVTWNPIKKFATNTENVGKGGFGVVKKATFNAPEMTQSYEVIIKKVDVSKPGHSKLVLNEINGLVDLMDTGVIPKLYGCTLGTGGEAYLVQEILDHTLDSVIFKKSFLSYTTLESLKMHHTLFKALETLWDKGYSHNDIKPENMMTNASESAFYLIDLGLIDKNNGPIVMGGTPSFMSPARFSGGVIVKPKDDMYSMAISILIMEAKDGYDQVFGYKSNDYLSFPRGCRQSHMGIECRTVIIERAKRILSKEYGDYQAKSTNLDILNLTTLIINMIYYDDCNYSYKDVTSAIQRMIDEKAALDKEEIPKFIDKKIGQQIEKGGAAMPMMPDFQPLKVEKDKALAYKQEKLHYDQAKLNYYNLKNQRREISRGGNPKKPGDLGNNPKGIQQIEPIKQNRNNQLLGIDHGMELIKLDQAIAEAKKAIQNQQVGNLEQSNCYKEEGDLFKRRLFDDIPQDENKFAPLNRYNQDPLYDLKRDAPLNRNAYDPVVNRQAPNYYQNFDRKDYKDPYYDKKVDDILLNPNEKYRMDQRQQDFVQPQKLNIDMPYQKPDYLGLQKYNAYEKKNYDLPERPFEVPKYNYKVPEVKMPPRDNGDFLRGNNYRDYGNYGLNRQYNVYGAYKMI